MPDHVPPSIPASGAVVQLLDPGSGRPVQTWRFVGQTLISIGRSDDRDVTISDPYVSRHHASLAFREGEWFLVSVGKHGVLVGNSPVTEHPLEGDVSFRLGPSGPTLRFCTSSDREECKATITVDVETISLYLDDEKLNCEVNQIASGEYFQGLQARAAELRGRRNPRSTGG